MHKVLRFTALAILAASGLTACGDKVTNINQTPTTSTTTTTPVVHSVTVTPNAVSLNVGQSVQLVATVTADAGAARTVAWSSSAASVASVDATGKVTANAAGTAVIIATSTADAGVQGTAAITVAGTTNPTITISTVTDSTGAPALLNNIAGQINVTLNVDPGSTFIKEIDLLMNCGAGDVLVASQIVSAKAPMTGPSGATQPVTLPFNTAALDSTGTPKFKNGSCTLKAKLTTTTGGVFNSTNTTPITLNNASGYSWTITSTSTNAGWPSQTSLTNNGVTSGLVYNQGNVAVTIKAVNYTTGAPLKTITMTFMGKTQSLTPNTGTQMFVANYYNDSTKAAAQNIYQYTTPAGNPNSAEFAPAIGASVDTLGNNAFTGNATGSAQFRIDNTSPNAPASMVINAQGGASNWLNASYGFTGTGKYVSGGDNVSSKDSIVIGYVAPANYTALPTQPSRSLYCSTTGFTMVTSISQIPNSTVNNAYRARSFDYDQLGNVTCADLAVSNGGVASGLFTFGVDRSAPLLAFAATSVGVNKSFAAAAGNNFVLAISDTGSGEVNNLQDSASIVRNFENSLTAADCVLGAWDATHKVCQQLRGGLSYQVDNAAGGNGYYTISVMAEDQAGNLSPDSMRTALVDNVAPTVGAAGSQSPSPVPDTAAVTFSSSVSDDVDLGAWIGGLLYNTPGAAVTFAGTGGTFGSGFSAANIHTSGTAAVTANLTYQRLQGTDANGLIVAAGVGPFASITQFDIAGNFTNNAATAIVTKSAGADVYVNDTLKVTLSGGTVSKGATTPTSLTITAEHHGATATEPNAPYSTVYFYYLGSDNMLHLFNTQTVPAISDDNTGRRVFKYTITGVTAAMIGNATTKIYVVGVTTANNGQTAGNAVTNNLQAPTVTVVN